MHEMSFVPGMLPFTGKYACMQKRRCARRAGWDGSGGGGRQEDVQVLVEAVSLCIREKFMRPPSPRNSRLCLSFCAFLCACHFERAIKSESQFFKLILLSRQCRFSKIKRGFRKHRHSSKRDIYLSEISAIFIIPCVK